CVTTVHPDGVGTVTAPFGPMATPWPDGVGPGDGGVLDWTGAALEPTGEGCARALRKSNAVVRTGVEVLGPRRTNAPEAAWPSGPACALGAFCDSSAPARSPAPASARTMRPINTIVAPLPRLKNRRSHSGRGC